MYIVREITVNYNRFYCSIITVFYCLDYDIFHSVETGSVFRVKRINSSWERKSSVRRWSEQIINTVPHDWNDHVKFVTAQSNWRNTSIQAHPTRSEHQQTHQLHHLHLHHRNSLLQMISWYIYLILSYPFHSPELWCRNRPVQHWWVSWELNTLISWPQVNLENTFIIIKTLHICVWQTELKTRKQLFKTAH